MKLYNPLSNNPIIQRSLRNQKVDWRFVTVIILGFITYLPMIMICFPAMLSAAVFQEEILSSRFIREISLVIFNVTTIFLFIIVTLFAPILAIGAIAGERQRQTLDLLLITLIPIRSIVMGKLFSALIYTLLFIIFVWPIIILTLITGGVDLVILNVTIILLAVTAIAFTTIGLYVSSWGKTITNATMIMFGLVLPAFFIAPPLLMMAVTITLNLLNVGSQLEEVINFYGWSLVASLNPLVAAIYSAVVYTNNDGFLLISLPSYRSYYFVSPWFIYIVIYSAITVLLLWLTTVRLQRMGG